VVRRKAYCQESPKKEVSRKEQRDTVNYSCVQLLRKRNKQDGEGGNLGQKGKEGKEKSAFVGQPGKTGRKKVYEVRSRRGGGQRKRGQNVYKRVFQ